MFIDFEGIDGSGKTTLSNRVAERLRQLGHRLCHAREGGELASPVAEKIRALTRDPRHLSLSERTELLLYAARECQTVDEVVRPALDRGEWVITDRYVYSHLALACQGRGLEASGVSEVLKFASGGLLPDLVIFVDVDPAIARARKRCGKLKAHKTGEGSRKGQGGAGLPCRVRQGFHALARQDPDRWVVLDNTWSSLEEAEELLVRVVLERAQGRTRHRMTSDGEPQSSRPAALCEAPPRDPAGLRRTYLSLVDSVAHREPALAGYLLAGLSGLDVDERRLRLSRLCPEVLARGLSGLSGEGPMTLRHVLKDVEPRYVARGLKGLTDDGSYHLRRELLERAPGEVARSLSGLEGPRAEALRTLLRDQVPGDVLRSLARLDTPEAWKLRDELGPRAGPEALAASLTGLDSPRAWTLRLTLLAETPVEVVESLAGVGGEKAHALRERFLAKAPKAVLRSLEGLDDEASHRLREQAGEDTREAVDSVFGLDSERAWALREQMSASWPGAVVGSLGPLAQTPRGRNLLFGLLARFPGDVDVLRQAAWVLDSGRSNQADALQQVG